MQPVLAVADQSSVSLFPVPGAAEPELYIALFHTTEVLLPGEEYFDSHPEYFALRDGERILRDGKLCESNPEVAKALARNLAALRRENPAIQLLSLSPSDGGGGCECQECLKLD